jgi:hypothetical protein
MKIICISGKAQHGKDTSAAKMKELLEAKGKKVLITHNADLLKFMAKNMFGWDGQKDDKGRQILQYIGTDVIRKQRPDYWIDFIISVLELFPNDWDYVLIPDCRFPNEIDKYKTTQFEATHLRVVRSNFVSPLTEEQQKHASEIALDDVVPDIVLANDGSLDELYAKIAKLVETM